jgi:glycosyltransferase involved in cell wall biosynthesis
MIAPLVSVCIPTFNGELFIAETIDCVLKQTYKPIEVIVSDDGSIDRTLAIIEELLTPSNLEFQILKHDRLGLGNTGTTVFKMLGESILNFYCKMI